MSETLDPTPEEEAAAWAEFEAALDEEATAWVDAAVKWRTSTPEETDVLKAEPEGLTLFTVRVRDPIAKAFDESKHPRVKDGPGGEKDGRFATKAGGVASFLEEFEEKTFDNPLNYRVRITNFRVTGEGKRDYTASVKLYRDGDEGVHIEELVAITRGGGRKAMEFLTELADKHGVVLDLYASPLPGVRDQHLKRTQKQLMAWYREFGFEGYLEPGEHRVRSKESPDMTRPPKGREPFGKRKKVRKLWEVFKGWSEAEHPRIKDGPGGSPDGRFAPKAVTSWTTSDHIPEALHGVAFAPWAAPHDLAGWAKIPDVPGADGTPMPSVPGKKHASGVIMQEPDGRVWIVEPTNHFGGYEHTFPKGKLEKGLTLQQNALKEAFEESGLRAEIVGHVMDVERDTSVARYYLARRIGGTPTAHGWESQAVKLATLEALTELLNRSVDRAIAAKIPRRTQKAQERWGEETPWAPSGPGPGRFKSSDEILGGGQVGEQGGTNKGGAFLGRDGVQRYVKFYANPVQGAAEHLANSIYRDLGLEAASSSLFEHDGKLAFATEWIPNAKRLNQVPLTPARANAILDGFAADILTNNWDAVGMGHDNVVYREGTGRPIRVDNGGTFQFRAQGKLKTTQVAPDDLHDIKEFTSLFQRNRDYRAVWDAAGVTPDTLGARLTKQVERIVSFRRSLRGGWLEYVQHHIPGTPKPDQELMAQMLEARTRLLAKRARVPYLTEKEAVPQRWGSEIDWAPDGPAPGRYRGRGFSLAPAMAALHAANPPGKSEVERAMWRIEHEPLAAMEAWKSERFLKYTGRLSVVASQALDSYIGTSFEELNDFLRGFEEPHRLDRTKLEQRTRGMDEATKAWELTETVRVYRMRKSVVAHEKGEYIHDRAFVSTSMSRRAATKFGQRWESEAGTLYRIHLPPGTTIAKGNEYESELILPRNALFRVIRARDITYHGIPKLMVEGVKAHRQTARLVDLRYVGSGRHPVSKDSMGVIGHPVQDPNRFEWRDADLTTWREP